MDKIISVYAFRNVIDNKRYIGSSIDTNKRKAKHINFLNQNKHHNLKFQNAWNKYGKENFVFEIIERFDSITDEPFLRAKEKEYFDIYKVFEYGYNLSTDTIAPMTGRKQSLHAIENSRNHMIEYNTSDLAKTRIIASNKRRKGEKRSDKVKAEMSKRRTGKKFKMSAQGKENISIAQKKLRETLPVWNVGIPHKESTKKAISDQQKDRVCYNNGIRNIKLKTGESIPIGFTLGFYKGNFKIFGKWFNNGLVNKRIPPNDEIPNGFILGRLSFKPQK